MTQSTNGSIVSSATLADIKQRFSYHAPSSQVVANLHGSVRDAFLKLAEDLVQTLPQGREVSLVLTNLEQAMFWANAAIARHLNYDAPEA